MSIRSLFGSRFSVAVWMVLFNLVGLPLAYADLATLLAMRNKPTIREFKQNMPYSTNPLQPLVVDLTQAQIRSSALSTLSLMEKAYPGAIYAFLGRDSSRMADLFEAFYEAHGQPNRVVRLNASGNSFGSTNDYFNLIYSAGLVDINGKPLYKFVLIDATSWGAGSQLRNVLTSVYKTGGLNARAYWPFVNAVDLKNSGHVNAWYADRSTPSGSLGSGSLGSMMKLWDSVHGDSYVPSSIPTLAGSISYLPQYGNSEVVWHGKFGLLRSDGQGKFVADPGPQSSAPIRQHVLWWMYEVVQAIQNPEFDQMLKDYARDHYQYPILERLDRFHPEIELASAEWVADVLQNNTPMETLQSSVTFQAVCKNFETSIQKFFALPDPSLIKSISPEKILQLLEFQSRLPFAIVAPQMWTRLLSDEAVSGIQWTPEFIAQMIPDLAQGKGSLELLRQGAGSQQWFQNSTPAALEAISQSIGWAMMDEAMKINPQVRDQLMEWYEARLKSLSFLELEKMTGRAPSRGSSLSQADVLEIFSQRYLPEIKRHLQKKYPTDELSTNLEKRLELQTRVRWNVLPDVSAVAKKFSHANPETLVALYNGTWPEFLGRLQNSEKSSSGVQLVLNYLQKVRETQKVAWAYLEIAKTPEGLKRVMSQLPFEKHPDLEKEWVSRLSSLDILERKAILKHAWRNQDARPSLSGESLKALFGNPELWSEKKWVKAMNRLCEVPPQASLHQSPQASPQATRGRDRWIEAELSNNLAFQNRVFDWLDQKILAASMSPIESGIVRCVSERFPVDLFAYHLTKFMVGVRYEFRDQAAFVQFLDLQAMAQFPVLAFIELGEANKKAFLQSFLLQLDLLERATGDNSKALSAAEAILAKMITDPLLVSIWASSIKTPQQMIRFVKNLPHYRRTDSLVESFLMLNPSIPEINHMIVLVNNTSIHQKLATWAMSHLKTREEYDLLIKPKNQGFFSDYRKEKRKAKRRIGIR